MLEEEEDVVAVTVTVYCGNCTYLAVVRQMRYYMIFVERNEELHDTVSHCPALHIKLHHQQT